MAHNLDLPIDGGKVLHIVLHAVRKLSVYVIKLINGAYKKGITKC